MIWQRLPRKQPLYSELFNDIFIYIDKIIKWAKLIPHLGGVGVLTTSYVAHLSCYHVVCSFGVPYMVLYNYDPWLASQLWITLQQLVGHRVSLSFAYHLKSDGLTKHMHSTIKQVYSCFFIAIIATIGSVTTFLWCIKLVSNLIV